MKNKMSKLYVGIAFLLLAYPGYLALRIFFRKTRFIWIRALFPIGYRLYKTKLGYALHLKRLKDAEIRPHSITNPITLSMVTVAPIAVLDDNYSYLVIDTVTNEAVAIDPCDPSALMKTTVDNNATLKAVLTTHKHWDHAGGNMLLTKRFPKLMVFGGSTEGVPGATHKVKDKEILKFGRLSFEAILTPGHTTGHMIYKLQTEPPCVFSGDHIFICGNGQMFEGTAETMLNSIKKVMTFPKNTLLFPGHEYALKDVRFAVHLMPSNTAIQMKWQWVQQQRERGLSTVPSILSEEKQYNPFMLTESSELKDALGLPKHTLAACVLAELRKQKNAFEQKNW